MALRLRSWEKWQGPYLRGVRRMRKSRGTALDKPYSMPVVAIAASFDEEFHDFADTVGGERAETLLVRVAQHAALHSPFDGVVDVAPEVFGPVVLSRPWNVVDVATGILVHDALLKTTIAVKHRKPSRTRSARVPHTSGTSPAHVRDDPSPHPSPDGSPPVVPPKGGRKQGVNGPKGGTKAGKTTGPKPEPKASEGPPDRPTCDLCPESGPYAGTITEVRGGQRRILRTCECPRGRARRDRLVADRRGVVESEARRRQDAGNPRSKDGPRRLGDSLRKLVPGGDPSAVAIPKEPKRPAEDEQAPDPP